MKTTIKILTLTLVLTLVSFGLMPTATAQRQRAYRHNDNYMRQLFKRLETRTDRFSKLLPDALDRSRINGTQREDDVNKIVTDFEYATDQLTKRFENRTSTDMDAQLVLQHGSLINTFMNNRRLDYATERAWSLVKIDLDRLANSFDVARNWTTTTWPTTATDPVIPRYDAMLTGTYRLNTSLSNNPRTVAYDATRTLRNNERRTVTDHLVSRLTAPEMIALERRGNMVTLSSTISPQVILDVDGQQRTETYPNGHASQVRATFSGDRLTVVSNGDRANDFTVSFTPVNNGNRLLVTREIYAERLNRPVLVQSYYDRTSTIARWDLYNPNAVQPTAGTVRGTFLIPNGTQVIGVLNESLSTKSARNDDRFTMTVREPYEYRGAVIEGHVTGIERGGRVTGRSEMTLNFDRIRLLDGNTYMFAGIVQTIRGTNNEEVRVDTEGAVQDDNKTNSTVGRTAIGGAIGALIGAITGGGKGAAIGAAVGAGAGVGSVYVQGRDDLDLPTGTEITLQASAPRN